MKSNKIMYYGSTGLLSVALLGSAMGKLTKSEALVAGFENMGYPMYLMTLLGVAYIFGVVGIWQNKVPFLREWAYAGILFALVGALISHLSVGDPMSAYFPSVILIIVAAASYYSLRKL